MKTSYRLMVALFAILALLLAACGDDGADEPTDTPAATDEPTTEEPAATPTDEPTGTPTDDATATPTDGATTGDLGLLEEGTIVVGSDIAFEPFEFVEDGENKGFDIDLMNEIASRLGLEVEYVNTSFDTIFDQLAGGQFDAIISAITITEERSQRIAFSDPYFAANQAIAVQAGTEVAGVEDLAGMDVGVQTGTTGEEYASENFTDSNVVSFPTSEAAFAALTAGQVDAVFIDLPVVGARAEQGDVELAAEVDTGELYGIGVQLENTGLVDALNAQLEEIIADGTYEEIYSTWFEGDVPEQFHRDM